MRDEVRLRVDKRGRILIPVRFRKALNLNNGDKIVFSLEDGEVILGVQRRSLRRRKPRNAAIQRV